MKWNTLSYLIYVNVVYINSFCVHHKHVVIKQYEPLYQVMLVTQVKGRILKSQLYFLIVWFQRFLTNSDVCYCVLLAPVDDVMRVHCPAVATVRNYSTTSSKGKNTDINCNVYHHYSHHYCITTVINKHSSTNVDSTHDTFAIEQYFHSNTRWATTPPLSSVGTIPTLYPPLFTYVVDRMLETPLPVWFYCESLHCL